MIVTLHAKGMDLTPAIREYAEEKIQGLEKYFDHITKAEIDIGMESNHHNKGKIYYAEVNLDIPGHPTIRVVKESEDLYKAIDKVKDHLKVELDSAKEKMRRKDKEEIRGQKEYVLEDETDVDDEIDEMER
jgi:putative sigma-54 modulation protein